MHNGFLGKYPREPVALKAGNVSAVSRLEADSDDIVREGAIVLPRVRSIVHVLGHRRTLRIWSLAKIDVRPYSPVMKIL